MAGQESATLRCAGCGASFRCGIGDPGGCWCARLPSLPPAAYVSGAGCVCEDCLRAALASVPAADRPAER